MANHALTIRGAGSQKTVVQSPGPPPTTTFALGTGSLKDVGIELAPGSNNIGLDLEGTASRVAITSPANSTTGLGVRMIGGALQHSVIALAAGGASTTIGAQLSPLVIAGGDIEDTTITAATGADSVGPLVRDRIHATVGFTGTQGRGGTGYYTIADTIINTRPGTMPETAVKLVVAPDLTSNTAIAASCTCLHDTFFGSGLAGSTGFLAGATASASQLAYNLNSLQDVIIRGYATSISRSAAGTGNSALANVAVTYSDFQPGREQSSNTGTGTGDVSADATDINQDPLFTSTTFASPVAFRLRVRSPAIDAGLPTEPANSSPLDVAEAPRDVDGRNTGDSVGDIGAFEFQPHAPTAVARGPRTALVGARSRFSSTGSRDLDLGDTLRFAWRFDDGARLQGATVHHAFTTPGKHVAVLTVTDFYGRTASAVTTVLVRPAPPRLTHLAISRLLVITYRDSRAASTALTVFRQRPGRLVKVRSFQHHDRAGQNRVSLKRLSPGDYVLRAVPSARGQTGHTVSVAFTVAG
jgi:hypothetical protein